MNKDNLAETQEEELSKDEKNWGMFCHLSSFAGLFIPFGMIIAPLVIWLMKKDEYDFVDDQGKESLNFQITIAIAILVSSTLIIFIIGFFLIFIVGLYWMIMVIIATIKTEQGETYRYPITIRLIK